LFSSTYFPYAGIYRKAVPFLFIMQLVSVKTLKSPLSYHRLKWVELAPAAPAGTVTHTLYIIIPGCVEFLPVGGG
jgi:hypothetical protein